MKNYFIDNNIKYEIEYEENQLTLYKWMNQEKRKLSEIETKTLLDYLKQEYSYRYSTEKLNEIVGNNPNIENKEQTLRILTWLESIIKEEYRDNLYRNLKTLKIKLNWDTDIEKKEDIPQGYVRCGGYNTQENSLEIDEETREKIWEIAKKTKNKEEYYWNHINQIILHELTHMASTKYDGDTKIVSCGFDKYPTENIEEQNRGLTEGFTEMISMIGVPTNDEIASGYFIEVNLIYQLIILLGKEVFMESYFTNQGTKKIEKKCKELINHPTKSFELFRNIELNYIIRHNKEEQSILGNIQSSLLDYLEAKLKKINNQEEIDRILKIFEAMLITKDKIIVMGKNPSNYIGLEESTMKFDMIKDSYRKENQEDSRKQL